MFLELQSRSESPSQSDHPTPKEIRANNSERRYESRYELYFFFHPQVMLGLIILSFLIGIKVSNFIICKARRRLVAVNRLGLEETCVKSILSYLLPFAIMSRGC
ncbi:hypothetical protein CEXT_92241 [Caerostris extrusa]|uniref:Uncharacterized protein n=1 Tax=Caerostris extrusa TaxID=172846 RepID=A0AAV4NP48_CAEEX|nr:hypothetical protein CEXT_92241 [Caerostris extrusa]